MSSRLFLAAVVSSVIAGFACGDDLVLRDPGADALSGGRTTVFDSTKDAYGQMSPTVKGDRAEAFTLGHSIFDRTWVAAPATTEDEDGLGPLYNQRSCSACHSHDGRAPPFDARGAMLGMLFRVGIPGADGHGGPLGDPVYGTQIRPSALLGIPPDAVPRVAYDALPGTYGDGTPYSLQRPRYAIAQWGYGPPAPGLTISARVAPFTIGLGLLEAIPESDILARAAASGGRPNHVWDPAKNAVALGRFGWKANVPSVLVQTAGALVGDMGITSRVFPDDACTPRMSACKSAPSGGAPEIDDARLNAVVFYQRTLAVPARRAVTDPAALHGEELFAGFGCTGCHAATFETGPLPDLPEVEHQTIHPYTDLLLHEMGPDLADGRADYEATGSEWRTPPLWGIGLLHTVNGHELLLHDARARGMEEAILWHGGQATAARESFRMASAADRAALVAFLHSL